MRTNRRRGRTLLLGAVVAAVSLAFAGCSAGGSETTSASQETDPNGTFVFGITADPTQMIPWTSTSTQSNQVLSQIYTPLLGTDKDQVPQAGIADMPEVSTDGLTYTFTLKEGIKFSNGDSLTSADVKYTFDQIMDPESGASSASFFASVDSVEAPTPETVEVHMKHVDASFPAGLTHVNTGIVPKGVAVKSLETQPVGAGPYEFESRKANQSITLKRNPDFYAGEAGAATLEFRIIADPQSMASALKTGSVDAAIFDNPVTAKTTKSNNTKTVEVGSLQYHVIQLRAAVPQLKDVNARLAIQCAVSRSEVLDSAALGAGTVTGPITSPQFQSDPNAQPCPEQDLAKAKEYLEKAGEPDGFTLDLMTSQGLYSTAVAEAENVQAQLAKIGIKVNVETLDSNTYVEKWLSGDFEAAVAMNAGSPDPNTMYARYFTKTGSYNKVAGYSSPTLDKLFKEGIATNDLEKRQAIYVDVSKELVDNAPWIWLFTPKNYIVLNNGVQGFEARVDADLSALWKASVAK